MNRLTALLNQLQADEAAAQQQAAIGKNAHRSAMEQHADAMFLHALRDYAEELPPLVYERESKTTNQGLVVTWRLGSNDLQLTPTKIEWDERWCNSISFTVEGVRSQIFHWDDTEVCRATMLPQLLLAMRTAYPAYKAKVDELAQRDAKIEADKRQGLITNLAWPANWRSHRTHADIQHAYSQLIDLGETELAEQRMAEYRADVAAVQQREQQALARKAAYETAMTAYRQEMAAYDEDCRAWAESEQFRLWEPHTLWRIRYTSLLSAHHAGSDGDDYIQTIITLDSPSDIITQIQAHGMAQVDRVRCDGTILAGFTLVAFLDAEPLHYTTPPTETYQFHRAYHAGDYTVYVPPFILEAPAPAPIRPTAPQRDEQGDQW